MTLKKNSWNPAKLLLTLATNQKARFSKFVSSIPREWYKSQAIFMPDIGLRATQGHSVRNDARPGYLTVAQECLNLDQDDIPCFCVHGTDLTVWRIIRNYILLYQVAWQETEQLFSLQ